MPVLAKHRFTTSEYRRMAEVGVLRHDARVELLEGEIRDMSPIGPFHGGVLNRLVRLFTRASGGRYTVSAQNPIHLNDYSEPQPDLLLLRTTLNDYTDRHPQPGDVRLLIEIADTSLAYDREEKLPAYGRAGIPEVWIVNLEDQTIEVYREPNPGGFLSTTVLRANQTANSLAFPEVTVDIAELLKRG